MHEMPARTFLRTGRVVREMYVRRTDSGVQWARRLLGRPRLRVTNAQANTFNLITTGPEGRSTLNRNGSVLCDRCTWPRTTIGTGASSWWVHYTHSGRPFKLQFHRRATYTPKLYPNACSHNLCAATLVWRTSTWQPQRRGGATRNTWASAGGTRTVSDERVARALTVGQCSIRTVAPPAPLQHH